MHADVFGANLIDTRLDHDDDAASVDSLDSITSFETQYSGYVSPHVLSMTCSAQLTVSLAISNKKYH